LGRWKKIIDQFSYNSKTVRNKSNPTKTIGITGVNVAIPQKKGIAPPSPKWARLVKAIRKC